MKLDFKHFKKSNEDEHSVTLKHPRGHEIKIAKKALNESMRADLSKIQTFKDGGEVKKEKPPIDEDKAKEVQDSFKKALGFSDGGSVLDEAKVDPNEYVRQHLSRPETAMPAQPDNSSSQMVEQPDWSSPRSPLEMAAGRAPVEAPQEAMPSNVPLGTPQASSLNVPAGNPIQEGMDQYSKGVSQQAQAEGKLGNAEASIAHDMAKAQLDIQSRFQQKTKGISEEIHNVTEELKANKIDPNKFWHDRSTAGKISSAIGLILGGIAQGVNGGENPALKFLNQQIDRNIEGQKANMDSKGNVLKALQQQMGNEKDAAEMYRLTQVNYFASKLQEEAAKSKDPLAQARMHQALGELSIKYGPNAQALGMRQSALEGMQSGSIKPAVAARFIITDEGDKAKAYKEIEEHEKMSNAVSNVTKAMRDVQSLQTVGNRTMSPIQSRAQINALNLQIGALGKDIFGRLNEQELKMLADSHVGLADSAKTVDKKIDNITKIMTSHASHPVLDSYGIKLPKAAQFNPSRK